MRRLTLSLTLCLLFSIAGLAQEKSLLWKVSGNELKQPSYIYGTIHLICPQDYTMRDEIKSAFSSTEQVYLEVDFDDPQMMQKMMGLAMLNNGKSVKDYLTDDEYALLDNTFKTKLGAGMDKLGAMKPLMLLSMGYMSILSCQPMAFETVFTNMAQEQNKEVLGLETIEFQMSLFDQIPFDEQYKMIADFVRQKDKAAKEFTQLVYLYKDEDIYGLLNMMDESEWSMPEHKDLLIFNRNKDWAEKFDTIANTKSTFFAVGAGHLAGEKGFLNLLKEKGYKVEPVL